MIYLDDILNYINSQIQLPNNVTRNVYGLAEIVNYDYEGKKKTLPFVNGEGIEFIDTKDLIIYHKIINESFDKFQGYGNRDLTIQKATMQLVVVSCDRIINVHNLAAVLSSIFSVGYLPTNLGLNVHRIGLDLQGITYQTFPLLKSDFGLEKNDLRAKAFAINYTIECVYSSDCINICC